VLLLIAGLAVRPAVAAAPEGPEVDVALVLVTDVSRSIDDSEFQLEKRGYQAAFTNPDVIAAIKDGPAGAIAVAYVEFASSFDVKTVVNWTVIRDDASARAFAAHLVAAPRSFWGRTAIGAGLELALDKLAASGVQATRQVIDVCGDGTSNAGPPVEMMRDRAIAAGITINGLAIINEHPVAWTFAHVQPPGGLPGWYRAHVTGGPGSFVVEVHDFASFGRAMTRKLISEIASRLD